MKKNPKKIPSPNSADEGEGDTNMKKIYLFLSALTVIAGFAACTADETDAAEEQGGVVSHVRFSVADFEWADTEAPASTRHRTRAEKSVSSVNFVWTDKDTVGIYSTSGSQMEFPIDTGAGEKYAEFNGGCWALKNKYVYTAYYPFNKYNLDRSKIPFVYGTAKQVGNDNVDYLTEYDYIVSQSIMPTDGEVTFTFRHIGALAKFIFTMPEADDLMAFSLVAPTKAFPKELDLNLSGLIPKYTVAKSSKSFNMRLSDISVDAGGKAVLYALMPYTNLSGMTLTAILYGNKGKCYTTTLDGQKMDSGGAYQYKATLTALPNTHEWVDLGLPSGLKWATCNIGAEKPEKFGNYYAWGETVPPASGDYSWESYSLCNGSATTLTRYNNNPSYGFVDNLTELEPDDDAATVQWGFPWHIPSYEDFDELRRECKWAWGTKNGVYGCKFTGPNGNTLFLPAAGYRNIESLNFAGSYGYYWSSSLNKENPSQVHIFYFQSSFLGWGVFNRYYGRSIRPVCD